MKFQATVDKVTNEEVKDAAAEASARITELSDQYVTIAQDPTSADADELTAAGDRTRTAMEKLQAACV